ncbi:enolase C-terminal domain-like protein [Ceratobasidium sp. AG-I]|nr:enolase C-terminal domain-like protein [Ceratobasidium sp. AG-I]
MPFPTITKIKTFVVPGEGEGGDYHSQKAGHWIIGQISNPMSRYEQYKASRVSWGINVLGSFCVQLTASDGSTGFATGMGGPPSCWLVEQHFKRFLEGADPRDTSILSDQMLRASMYYGRKGLVVATISVIDLALWDLVGKIRKEPVYKMIGGRTRDHLSFYCTGPLPAEAKRLGFWGGKVPLTWGPADGQEGMRKNYEELKKHRESVGPDFPIMVDCYMSLTVQYAIELATLCLPLNITWWEEVLHPDAEGYEKLKAALPQLKWTTGEHEYTRYGFKKLLDTKSIDIIQPDIMWCGGLTELLRITSLASAYDVDVVCHGSGPYSYHFAVSQSNTPFTEIICNAPDGKSVKPVFGNLFTNEVMPINGRIELEKLDAPGFGLELNPNARLIDGAKLLTPDVDRPIGEAAK